MNVSINQITPGMGILYDGEIYLVIDQQHVKPGKGGAFARVKLRNFKTAQVLDRTFKPADKFDVIDLEERKLQYQYNDGSLYHFMDLATYEETAVKEEVVAEIKDFLQDNLEVVGVYYNNQILKINLPTFILAEVVSTDLGLKGDSSKAGTKPATIDTGSIVQVPLFISNGDRIKIDTRTGTYVERVKK